MIIYFQLRAPEWKKKNSDLASENSTDNRRCKMEVREWSLIRNHLRQSSSAKSISSTPTE